MTKQAKPGLPEGYSPPAQWVWDRENGGQFANINRPIAGATKETDLPVGEHPLQLYSLATPNGVKSRSCSKNCWRPVTPGRSMTPGW